MRSRVIAGIGTALLLVAPMVVPAPLAGAQDPDKIADQNNQRQPAMSLALKHLVEAKKALEGGSQEHGGHRVKAIQHVDQAIAETEQAINYYNQKEAGKKKK